MKDLFPIPLLHEKIALTNSNLYEEIKSIRATRSPDRNNYTSYYDKSPMEGVNWSELRQQIVDNCLQLYRILIPKIKPPETVRVNAWWNLYGYNNHHCWHAHGNSLFAGTYYVHMDELSVPLEFKSPLESLINSWQPGFGNDTRWAQAVKVHAATGDLLIWPGWIDHSVPEQKTLSDNLRCTISFNVLRNYVY